jgi:hypothetical protein
MGVGVEPRVVRPRALTTPLSASWATIVTRVHITAPMLRLLLLSVLAGAASALQKTNVPSGFIKVVDGRLTTSDCRDFYFAGWWVPAATDCCRLTRPLPPLLAPPPPPHAASHFFCTRLLSYLAQTGICGRLWS